ncbi:hypothetical protein DGG96_10515 [Legionella qingyii]|uniref:DUF3592 domain-containing protein n=1 Tax=Legionella qingyii TaxID=2184757 RepID=A0A317U394_9GAMM|nr:DUF3592 domain-containing protein [Legionella qingyii]PWY55718.1 hypothetical protein DGG96_10515 [Legionella qingyii]RUR21614.1 DUF3592 domain-containing protein [Legionella qingyii]RUR25118.1 DUF3592 domain-containing protein [Legionella qingyii]
MTWLNVWRWMLDLGWLFFLLILLRHFWRDRQVLMQAQSWLKVKGYITKCEWTKVGHSVWPKIEYTYQVDDKNLTGEYLFLDTARNNPNSKYSRGIAYKAAIAFQENTAIDIYYNPNDPEESALDVTMPIKLNIILILIGMLIVIHLGLMAWHYLG